MNVLKFFEADKPDSRTKSYTGYYIPVIYYSTLKQRKPGKCLIAENREVTTFF